MAIEVGDWVRVDGQSFEGEVLEVRGPVVVVDLFGIRSTVNRTNVRITTRPQTGQKRGKR